MTIPPERSHVSPDPTRSAVAATLAALGLRHDLQRAHATFLQTLEQPSDVPERVLTLCRERVIAVHRGEPTPADEELTSAERAALTLAGRMPHQHHQLSNAELAAVTEHFGPSGCAELLTAIAFYDANCRMQTALTPLAQRT